MGQKPQEGLRILLAQGQSQFCRRVENALGGRFSLLGTVALSTLNLRLWDAFCPEILVFLVPSPDETVCRLIQSLSERRPACHFAVAADSFETGSVADLVLAGCGACFASAADRREITEVVRRLAEGTGAFGYAALRRLRQELLGPRPPVRAATEREKALAQFILQGATNREIAAALYLSEGTVKNLVSALLAKYGFKSRSQLVSLLFPGGGM